MKSLFSRAVPDAFIPEPTPTTATGWNSLSGATKLGIAGAVAGVGIAVVMWPTLSSKPAPVQAMASEQHSASAISDYESAPPAQDVAARIMGGPSTAVVGTYRPQPTEMALYAGPVSATASTVHPARSDAGPAGEDAQSSGGNSPLAASLSAAGIPPAGRAQLIRHPDFLIRPGDNIPCLPIDAQNSSRPGFTACRVPVWFRSSNQIRGLLPPGTRLFGQIKSGLQQNEERLGVLYTLIQTPWFDQPVAAPAADAMGRPGMDGDLKTFFWDRAGAVALYSLLDVGIGTGQNLASGALSRLLSNGGGTGISLGNQSQSLAGREFDATINKPPVLTRDQALPITVTVGQNIDLYDACMRAMQVDPMACPRQ